MLSSDRSTVPLEYAPQSREQLRAATWRKWTRRILWCALASVLTAVSVRIARHALYLYRQHQLMTHSAPLGPFEEDAAKNIGRVAWPSAATALLDTGNFPIFIHERRTSNGVSRLVVVEEVCAGDNNAGIRHLFAATYEPASLMPGSSIKYQLSRTLSHPVMRILDAKPDADDVSHFTITYELDDQRGVIDGWLVDERSVVLEPRDGPLKNPGLPPPASTGETRMPASRPS
jgi:hypothetical protein